MADYPNANDDTQLGLLQRIFAALTGGNAGGGSNSGLFARLVGAASTPIFASNTGAVDGWSAASVTPLLGTGAFSMVFNGTQWDRARGNVDGQFMVAVPSATAPGLLQHSRMSSADINAQVVKAGAGKVYGFQIFNNTASAKYVRLYDKASAPAPGTDAALSLPTGATLYIRARNVGVNLGAGPWGSDVRITT